jgi:adenine phosphoribosyltransferase
MDKEFFHKLFKTVGPAVLPVIHVKNEEQAIRNIRIAICEGAQGVFLINHDFSHFKLIQMLPNIRSQYPYLWMGVNFLATPGDVAFQLLGELKKDHGCHIDAYWADDACIDEREGLDQQERASKIKQVREASGWDGLYFGGTAFKCQRVVRDDLVQKAAEFATHFMDVVTTSGSGTGIAANIDKIIDMSKGCNGKALALASGVTPDNAVSYAPHVDAFLVATGISKDFYNLNAKLLRDLVSVCRSSAGRLPSIAEPDCTASSWYLDLIAPNTKGSSFAWLDPTSIYCNDAAFDKITDDLIKQIDNVASIDLVAGIDAMGFPLAAAIAAKLKKGFLAVRKGGKLCVEVDEVTYSCYAGSGKVMEMRKPAFSPSTRVLLVDQWMETGGTMKGAIELIERQNGVVAGIATICVETTELTQKICKDYKVYHVVPSHLQVKFDQHTFV